MPRDYWFEINGRPVIFFWNLTASYKIAILAS